MERLKVTTRSRTEFVDITPDVKKAICTLKIRSGAIIVYSPHTTAGVTIQENADPDVVRDMLLWLNRAIPHDDPSYRHAEGNSDAHIKSCLVGSSVTVIVENDQLVLGTWQGIYLCEFDGPRERTVMIQPLG